MKIPPGGTSKYRDLAFFCDCGRACVYERVDSEAFHLFDVEVCERCEYLAFYIDGLRTRAKYEGVR